MPDNAIFYHLAYSAAALIYIAYAVRLTMKRSKLMSSRSTSDGR